MTNRSDFTDEEWSELIQAPFLTGLYIMSADVSLTAMGKETKGMLQAVQAQAAPDEAQELVAAVAADIIVRTQNREKFEQPELDKSKDVLKQILDSILASTAVLAGKATADEINGFNGWLLSVAQGTAEAGKEGGFLGIGAVRVSEKEQAALDTLRNALAA